MELDDVTTKLLDRLLGTGWEKLWTPTGTLGARVRGRLADLEDIEVEAVRAPFEMTGWTRLAVELDRSLDAAELQKHLISLRQHISSELGWLIPLPLVRTKPLGQGEYRILLRETEIGRGLVYAGLFLAIGPEDKLKQLTGQKVVDPTYGMPGVWVDVEQRGRAERLGCMIFGPANVVATHLIECVRRQAAELLGMEDIEAMLQPHPSWVRPDPLLLHRLLTALLEEQVSIGDLERIMLVAAQQPVEADFEEILSSVRLALSKQIAQAYSNRDGVVNCIALTEAATRRLAEEADPEPLLDSLRQAAASISERGLQPIVLVPSRLRGRLRGKLQNGSARVVWLGYEEVATFHVVDTVDWPETRSRRDSSSEPTFASSEPGA